MLHENFYAALVLQNVTSFTICDCVFLNSQGYALTADTVFGKSQFKNLVVLHNNPIYETMGAILLTFLDRVNDDAQRSPTLVFHGLKISNISQAAVAMTNNDNYLQYTTPVIGLLFHQQEYSPVVIIKI